MEFIRSFKWTLIFAGYFLLCTIKLNSQIYCPADVTISCFSSLLPEECGVATVISGNYNSNMVKYIDDNQTNACNDGEVYRKFFVDINYDNVHSESEPYCTQVITMVYNEAPLSINYPSDLTLACEDDIPQSNPTWSSHPCALIGYTFEDQYFSFVDGACSKIVRHFTVINWCTYDAITGEGIYNGLQVIKIVNDEAPEISNCSAQIFEVESDCSAYVTLVNSALDPSDCPSGMLTWAASIDLWSDGTEDLYFGPNEANPFRTPLVSNGQEIKLSLPDKLDVGSHKIHWKVGDGCNNFSTCSTVFHVVDNKPPTPYCINFTGATLNGDDDGELVLNVDLFSIDALDNCSAKEDIQLSFSENTADKIKVIKCGDTGVQFFRIYYTDLAGNQDFCEVFMLVFDNGTCFGKYAPSGQVRTKDGVAMEGIKASFKDMDGEIMEEVLSDELGSFIFDEHGLYNGYSTAVSYDNAIDYSQVDIEDFVRLQRSLLGVQALTSLESLAADIDRNGRVDIHDLVDFKAILLDDNIMKTSVNWTFVPEYLLTSNDLKNAHNASIPYSSYNGGFDFIGALTGDIVSSESVKPIDDTKVATFEIKLFDDRVEIVNNSSFIADGLNIELHPKNEIVNSDVLIPMVGVDDAKYYGFGLGETYNTSDLQLIVIHPYEGDKELVVSSLIKSIKIVGVDGNLISVEYDIIDNRTKNADHTPAKSSVYPTPFVDEIFVEGIGISSLDIYDVKGNLIESKSMDKVVDKLHYTMSDRLPHGIYLIGITSTYGYEVIKLVK